MPSSAHEDPLGSLFAKIRMWNFFIWTSWFWTSPEAAHPKLPQTEADAPSQWPLNPLMSQPMSLTPHTSEVHNPNAELTLENKRPKVSYSIKYRELIPHSLSSLLWLPCSAVMWHNSMQFMTCSCRACIACLCSRQLLLILRLSQSLPQKNPPQFQKPWFSLSPFCFTIILGKCWGLFFPFTFRSQGCISLENKATE